MVALTVVFLATFTGSAGASPQGGPDDIDTTDIEALIGSGSLQFNGTDLGSTALTQCPQAGKIDMQPHPTQSRQQDKVEQISQGGDDRRANQDFACQPQNETSIDVNPRDPMNVVGGANDYRIGTGFSGFYSSTDNGQRWYDGLQVIPSQPNSDIFDAGGDPAVAFDRDGIVYYADIGFNRTNGSNGVFVHRSGNGGFTWSRPRVGGNSPSPRLPGDGVVDYQAGLVANPVTAQIEFQDTPYDTDKEYITAGPRPAGVEPQCFTAAHTVKPCGGTNPVGVDRLYVTWTRFSNTEDTATIYESHSDDQARSWSPATLVSLNSTACSGGVTPNACDDNQGSIPTVNAEGVLFVGYENFNTNDENQYLVSKSVDGGNTFLPPSFVTPVFDVNYPRASRNRLDCNARGLARRSVLTNSCFRVNAFGNVVADRRPGFGNNVYVVIDDNRNGTPASSNVDVFFFRSTDGGTTWIGPTRVNDDPSNPPTTTTPTGPVSQRNCGRLVGGVRQPACPAGTPNYGNDQFFPWIDVGEKGDLVIGFHDRRLDTDSTASEWPTSRQRPGNYLVWYFGGLCQVSQPTGRECVAPTATTSVTPTAPSTGPNNTVFPTQTVFPFTNIQISDTPSNFDYTFGNGIFAGDYSGVAAQGDRGYALWTDARNGRGSLGPAPGTTQPGRNPACEQSDVFYDSFSLRGSGMRPHADQNQDAYTVTPCPIDNLDRGNGGSGKG